MALRFAGRWSGYPKPDNPGDASVTALRGMKDLEPFTAPGVSLSEAVCGVTSSSLVTALHA